VLSFSLPNNDALPIGLDIGHGWIKMVQFAQGEKMSVRAAQKLRIDDEPVDDPQKYREKVIAAVRQLLTKDRFQGRNVVTALANENLQITSLRLAQMSEEETYRAVMDEAAGRFKFNSDSDVVRYMPVGQARQGDELKNEFVLFAAGGQVVREHIEMLREADLVPVGLDTVACALFRGIDRLFRREEDLQRTLVFLDVGKCYTTVVFGRGGEIAFVKEIPIGTQRFDEEIADKLAISVPEAQLLRAALRAERSAEEQSDENLPREEDNFTGETSTDSKTAVQTSLDVSTRQVIVDAVTNVSQQLAREISLCFKYYTVTFRGKRVERAIFSGGGTYENTLVNVLRRQLMVDVEIAEPFRGFNTSGVSLASDRKGELCEWTVAVGLALKGLER
jgi:type IV pilus assembly protein PilM